MEVFCRKNRDHRKNRRYRKYWHRFNRSLCVKEVAVGVLTQYPRLRHCTGACSVGVAEPPKLSRLKCVNHHHKDNISLNALQTEQFLVCRVTSRYNHRFSDRTSIPRTKASSEILQPQFYNSGIIIKFTNRLKTLLQSQLK